MKIAIIGCEKQKVSVLLKYLKKNRKDSVVQSFSSKDTDGVEEFIKDDPYAMIVFDTDNNGFFTAEKLSERHRGLKIRSNMP